ncbi:MAG: RNA polymerase factor sigma-54, partial [Methylophilaceae bacterium]|nr:RNA polymerase factor sigma-54 [Methylophilaceae bacterium]
MMKQGLQLKVSQNLALTPQLQQSIRLLQLSTLELNQELEIILQENPLLELVEGDDDSEEYTATDATKVEVKNDKPDDPQTNHDAEIDTSANAETSTDTPISDDDFKQNDFDEDYQEYGSASNWDEGSKQNDDDDDHSQFSRQESTIESLHDHLLNQIKLLPLSERDQHLVRLLIDSIDENGYLESSLEVILASLPEELEVDLLELETALKHIQNLDSVGIGATNLQECILLQLNALPNDTPDLTVAKTIVKEHLQVLA